VHGSWSHSGHVTALPLEPFGVRRQIPRCPLQILESQVFP
jgi:hypothetical protein